MSETLPEPLTGCACRWDSSDKRVATCERHLGWLDAVGEWSARAFASEAHAAKLCAARDAEIERLTLERDVNKRMRDQHFAEFATLRAAAAQALEALKMLESCWVNKHLYNSVTSTVAKAALQSALGGPTT